MKRVSLLLAGGFVALLALGGTALAVVGVPLADIRPASVSLDADPAAELRGRAMLDEMLQAHGGPAADRGYQHTRFELHDLWVWPGAVFNPWPANDQRAEVRLKVHSFDSEATLTSGPAAGTTWGITDWQPWTRTDGQTRQVDDGDIRFMLPTVHYFFEMPQRLTEAELVRYVGQEEVRGQTYDVVYATWGTMAANPEFDQYLIYLDPETHRLAKVSYTVREVAPVAAGVAHMLDQEQIGGLWVPTRIPVTPAVDTDPAENMHEMVLSKVRFEP